jgi:cytochrome c oxidase subunit 1
MSHAAWLLGVIQFVFFYNFWWSLFKGKKVENDNPWEATTLEWQTPTPPPHGNFAETPTVHRDPYEYSVPGASAGYLPQNAAEAEA